MIFPLTKTQPTPLQFPTHHSLEYKKVMLIEPMYTLIIPSQQDPQALKPRPGAIEFITRLSKCYNIILYSSRKIKILKKIQKILDPNSENIKQLIPRKACYLTNQKKFFKDLNIVKNQNLKDMLIVDYKPQSFFPCLDNGYLIPHWNGDGFDDQLGKKTCDFLKELAKEHNIFFRLRAKFKLRSILDVVLGKKKQKKKIIDFNKDSVMRNKGNSTPTTADVSKNKG